MRWGAGHTPLQLGPSPQEEANKTAGKAGGEARGGVVGKVLEHKGEKINPYLCLDASVRAPHSEFIVSQKQNVTPFIRSP